MTGISLHRAEPSKSPRLNANPPKTYSHWGVSEVALMSAMYPLSVHRRVERRWTERMESLRQIRAHIVDAAERTLQSAFDEPIPVKIRMVADSRAPFRRRD